MSSQDYGALSCPHGFWPFACATCTHTTRLRKAQDAVRQWLVSVAVKQAVAACWPSLVAQRGIKDALIYLGYEDGRMYEGSTLHQAILSQWRELQFTAASTKGG